MVALKQAVDLFWYRKKRTQNSEVVLFFSWLTNLKFPPLHAYILRVKQIKTKCYIHFFAKVVNYLFTCYLIFANKL